MIFIDKVTGNDLKREYKNLNERVSKLPTEYQQVWDQIFVKLSMRSNFSGRNLSPLYNGVIEMLEEMNGLGKTVEQIFDGDVDQFCDQLAIDEPSYDIRDKWRKRLNKKINKRCKEED